MHLLYTWNPTYTQFSVQQSLLLNCFNLFQGFCIPLELLENEKGNHGSKNEGGMGLEDGEGIKDVSDEIETQDQLEGANKPGHDETEEQVDCKVSTAWFEKLY